MLKHDGVYYLFYSGGFYGDSSYSLGYATASSPMGPFEKYEGNPILSSTNNVSGPGNNSFFYTADGKELFNAYHTHTVAVIAGGNLKPADAEPGIAPLYSFYIVDSGSEGYIATTDSLEIAINTDGNSGKAPYPRVWADPMDVGPEAQPELAAGEWQHIAVTQAKNGRAIFLNGELFIEPMLGPSSANFMLFLDQIQYCYGLQLGGWNCMWWDDIGSFAGEYDDVYLFNKALTQEEVQTVMNAAFGEL